MRVLLIGGGKVGSFLARELVAADHAVTVIEANPDRAQAITDDVDAVVLQGDGTDVGLLEAADVHRSDWLLAVTGLDEVNLVACQLGLTLGAKRVLARLNNPLNRPTFEALGLPVVAVTDLMVHVISQEVAVSDIERIAVLGRGQLSLCEIQLPEDFEAVRIVDLELPQPALIAVVLRGDEAIVPGATTRLHPGDRITAVTTVANEAALHTLFATNGGST
ncbi:MAG: NAD-binding protein [Acidimicrobiia bacterium]|nr:NAD-binding protein [Acidimicrobiia bacterium]